MNNFRFLCRLDKNDRKLLPNFLRRNYANPSGTAGSGAGKGGGAGGSVRESGEGLGRYGAAQEEGYFYSKEKEKLKDMKKKLQKNPEKPPDNVK